MCSYLQYYMTGTWVFCYNSACYDLLKFWCEPATSPKKIQRFRCWHIIYDNERSANDLGSFFFPLKKTPSMQTLFTAIPCLIQSNGFVACSQSQIKESMLFPVPSLIRPPCNGVLKDMSRELKKEPTPISFHFFNFFLFFLSLRCERRKWLDLKTKAKNNKMQFEF